MLRNCWLLSILTSGEKSILLVDDRIKTGATIKLARELLKEARSIKTFAVNGTADYALFDENVFQISVDIIINEHFFCYFPFLTTIK